MYCINCGKNNPEGSKFCQHCGIKLGSKQQASENVSKSEVNHRNEESIDSETSPYPYVISTWKLIILSIATFGLYEIYWFYKQWKSFKSDRGLKGNAWLHAIFAAIASYYLFKEVAKAIREMDKSRGLQAGWLAITYLILVSLWRLPDNYWWLSMLSFWPLIPVQNAINYYWEKKYDGKVAESNFGTANYIWAIGGAILIILALYGTFGSDNSSSSGNTTDTTTPQVQTAAVNEWQTFYGTVGNFSVLLPATPAHSVRNLDSSKEDGGTYDEYSTSTDDNNTGYIIDVFNFPNLSTSSQETVLDASLNGIMGTDKNNKLISSNLVDFNGSKALDYLIQQNNMSFKGRIITAGNYLYGLMYAYYTVNYDSNGYGQFINSFQLR